MARTLPNHADLIDYEHAVAGHDGILRDADGELFIKPCTAAEIAFYESSRAYHPEFVEHMPNFLGSLTLDQQQNGTTIEEAGAALIAKHSIPEVVVPKRDNNRKIATKQAIVLENAAHGFVKPNIMDLKLGVRLWADDALQEKKARFDKLSDETTHKDLGFRIAGMRVYQGPNAVGKDIDAGGHKIYDRDYGRLTIHKDNVQEAFRDFIFIKSAGIDEELGKLVTQAFLADVSRIQEILEAQESRMFSSSLLFVFEGDGAALRSAMEEASKPPATLANGDANSEEDDDEDENPRPKIYDVKIIDFAHADWTPGEGPDENSLKGVRSVVNILQELSESG
ncbi:Kinase [Venustampulla echinocandica]|uniref:Kinase n=1 Tax=Venustampulla echinocandica TaxID=2656787 RepID=A0A370TAD7_9HELO|nr:Kinase [Venustampulla echinocandica]RDL30762.1 Kinase [Venustampulla echinocandica]